MSTFTDSATDELQVGHQLARGAYTITEVKTASDSGFNYSAETSDGTAITIREFYLSDICQRENMKMTFNSSADRNLFRKMVRGFINDAQFLKSLENPHIALVSDVFEENGTAYMVTIPPKGKTLEEIIETRDTEFKPVEVARIANHLLTALIEIHAFKMLHRNIFPRNIKISDRGDAILIADFGTFRRDQSRVSKVISSVLRQTNAHAPLEFIFEGSEQNEASDVYSVGSVIYTLMTGNPPVPCQDRLAAVAAGDPDPYVPVENNHTKYDQRFLRSVDMSLRLLNEERIRSATEFLNCFAKDPQSSEYVRMRTDAINRRPKTRGIFSFLRPRLFASLFRT